MSQELLPAIALCAAAALFAAGGVQLAGCFPAAERPPALRSSAGTAAVLLLLAALVLLFAAGLWIALEQLSWPVALIAACLGLLNGPLLWQRLRLDSVAGTAGAAAVLLAVAGGLALWADAGRTG